MADNRRSQHDHFTIKGYWWLPLNNKKVAGELSYTESGLTLSLYGGLSEYTLTTPISGDLDVREHSMIYGETLDNVQMTVLNSFYTQWVPNITSFSGQPGSKIDLRQSRLHCSMMLEGAHLSSVDETFTKCRLTIPSLDTWLEVQPFKSDFADSVYNPSLHYEMPQQKHYEVEASKCRISFIHFVTPPGLTFGQSPTISHRTSIEIETSNGLCCKEFIEICGGVVDLFSTLYGGPLVSSHLSLFRTTEDKEIFVFYPRHEVEPKEFSFHDFLIRFREIEDCFTDILNRWMKPSDCQKRARKLLISSERRPTDFIELRFLPLAHAVEVLSNEASQTSIIEKNDFNKIREKMLDAVKEDISAELLLSIKNSLQWATGRSLRDKLRSLLSEVQEKSWQLFAMDKEAFLGGIVRTRNHYTHYSTKAGHRILQGVELHWGIQKLSLMIRIFLLKRAGIPEEVIHANIQKNPRLSSDRRDWREISEEGSKYVDFKQ